MTLFFSNARFFFNFFFKLYPHPSKHTVYRDFKGPSKHTVYRDFKGMRPAKYFFFQSEMRDFFATIQIICPRTA